jgi:probable biosynthetic protein (TIGR04098 family)
MLETKPLEGTTIATARSCDITTSTTGGGAEFGRRLIPSAALAPFRLGMPHMSAKGACRGWLLREACHIHWGRIAGQIGANPTEFRDRRGARVLPSVVACTVKGDARAFAEDDLCRFHLFEVPTAGNGWRSELALMSDRGAMLKTEIVTRFARRDGASNTSLVEADLEDHFRTPRNSGFASRSDLIRRLGEADRIVAEADGDVPFRTVPIERDIHIDGVGLVYFARIHDMVARCERGVLPVHAHSWPMLDRRMHFFGNLDAGDELAIHARAEAEASTSAIVRSFVRRASDGAVIATAESLYGRRSA